MIDQQCQPGILVQFGNFAAIDAIGDLFAALVEQIESGAGFDGLDASLELFALETCSDIEKATIFEFGELYDRVEIVLTIGRAADERLIQFIGVLLLRLHATVCCIGITLHLLEEIHTLRTEIGDIANQQIGGTLIHWQTDAALRFVGYFTVELRFRLRLW